MLRAFLLAVCAVAITSCGGGSTEPIQVVQLLSGQDPIATCMNATGVVGGSVISNGERKAALWESGSLRVLGGAGAVVSLADSGFALVRTESTTFRLNPSGVLEPLPGGIEYQAVGPDGSVAGMRGTQAVFVEPSGTEHVLPRPGGGGDWSRVICINENRRVLGGEWGIVEMGLLWTFGSNSVRHIGASYSDLNDRNEACGGSLSDIVPSVGVAFFRAANGAVTTISAGEHEGAYGRGLNNHGVVVGGLTTPDFGFTGGFVWSAAQGLRPLRGVDAALDIADDGTILVRRRNGEKPEYGLILPAASAG